MPARPLMEVCIASAEDALVAEEGGADRLELNQALELGGLSPSLPLLEDVLQCTSLPVLAMVRPRAGGFSYSIREKRQMLREAELFLETGIQGIVCGALSSSGELDRDFWIELVSLCTGREIVFHRAIDEARDPFQLIDQLVETGTTRILTSGGAPTAIAGASTIRRMLNHAQGRIEILPGAGVNAGNVQQLLEITLCSQIHGSFREPVSDIGSANSRDSSLRTSLIQVKFVKKILLADWNNSAV